MRAYLKEKGENPLFVNNVDAVKFFRENSHTCIVFDNVSFKEESRERLLALLEQEYSSTLHVSGGTIILPKNTRRYILSNYSLSKCVRFPLDDAVKSRIVDIDIGSLFLHKKIKVLFLLGQNIVYNKFYATIRLLFFC